MNTSMLPVDSQTLKTNRSPEIKDLVSALAKAQGGMKPAVFNRINPHFKTRYADFTSCMDACRSALSDNGLAVMQTCETIDGKLNLVTMLAHTSGQWMKSEFPLIASKMDSQGIGSAMTYAKRYSLCGMVGIVADEEGDDDGEAAVGRGRQEELVRQPPRPQPNPQISTKLNTQQVQALKELDARLDQKAKSTLYSWLASDFKVEKIEDLLMDAFQKVAQRFENAVKYVEQQRIEQQKLEVAHV